MGDLVDEGDPLCGGAHLAGVLAVEVDGEREQGDGGGDDPGDEAEDGVGAEFSGDGPGSVVVEVPHAERGEQRQAGVRGGLLAGVEFPPLVERAGAGVGEDNAPVAGAGVGGQLGDDLSHERFAVDLDAEGVVGTRDMAPVDHLHAIAVEPGVPALVGGEVGGRC